MEERLANIHPGEILREDYLKPLSISPYRLAKGLGVPQTRVAAILAGKRAVTADTALRLSRFFRASPEFWMGLQAQYDLWEARDRIAGELDRLVPLSRPTPGELVARAGDRSGRREASL